MNIQTNADTMKFAVNQAAPRLEDPKLLRGEGNYTDDVNLAGQAHMWVARSPVAHGILKAVHTEAARRMPGVLAVYTQADLARAGLGGIPPMIIPLFVNRDGSVMTAPLRSPLALDRVRFAGEAVAVVVAETLAQAKDAAELVEMEIEALPAVTSSAEAARPGAPQLHADRPGNVALDYHYGDADAVAAAFAKAAHVTRMHIEQNRVVINPMEPRAAVAVYEADADRYTFYTCGQGALGMRNGLVNNILKTTADKVRVMMNNVGGSFGMKGGVFPEYPPLLLAAKELGRPVKWTDERSGSFLSDHHGRDQEGMAELALDKDGHFLALRLTGTANTGAWAVIAYPMVGAVKHLPGAYTIPLIEGDMKFVYTNTTPVGAYRGAGRPEGNFYMERLIDQAAAETGIDRVELRRRNYIRPDQMPYKNAAATVYDSGDFDTLMNEGLKQADVAGFAARKRASEAKGRLRGLGIVTYIEISGAGNELGGVRFEADGTVTMVSATHDHGQGHLSTFATVIHDRLGIPMDKIRLLQNDSDQLIGGLGTGGSRSAIAAGSALFEASDEVIARGTKIAAHVLEAAEQDIRFADGRFTIAGTDRSIGILELARKLREGEVTLPDDLPRTLDFERVSTAGYGNTYPNGCHVCEVEIDPDTGVVEVVRYHAVNDFGVMLNPTVVDGQLHGGVMQGIGQALLEHTVYNEDGQLLSGSFTDYAMPRADNGPSFITATHPIPTKLNPLGVKGCGEAGCAGSLPSIMNAIDDALRPLGVGPMNMPATPLRVWEAIQEARGR